MATVKEADIICSCGASLSIEQHDRQLHHVCRCGNKISIEIRRRTVYDFEIEGWVSEKIPHVKADRPITYIYYYDFYISSEGPVVIKNGE